MQHLRAVTKGSVAAYALFAEGDAEAVREEPKPAASKAAQLYSSLPRGAQFQLAYKTARATCEVVEGGVAVKAGSTACDPPSPRFELDCYATARQQLVEAGVLALGAGLATFTRDQFFSSASAAASVVRGVGSNADPWVSAAGGNLGDLLRKARGKSAA